jgi:hypothetical protein
LPFGDTSKPRQKEKQEDGDRVESEKPPNSQKVTKKTKLRTERGNSTGIRKGSHLTEANQANEENEERDVNLFPL